MQTPLRLLVASRNPGKLRELRALLAGMPIEVIGPDDVPALPDVAETASTFRENALLKARACATAAGCWALADDSGLEVDALGGAPGVRSARYAGARATDAENNAKLLVALAGVPDERRTARFRCVAVVVTPDGAILAEGEGATAGRILPAPRGSQGFGYDPLFLSDDLGLAFGQATPEQKHRVSHRGRALAAVRTALEARFRS